MAEPLTREAFEQSRSAVAAIARRYGVTLAAFSVGAAGIQLIFLRWADTHLARTSRLAIALPAFIAYMTVVGVLLWRMERRKRLASPSCPQCQRTLSGLSERVAAATGRCDSCGGVVVDDARSDQLPPKQSDTGKIHN